MLYMTNSDFAAKGRSMSLSGPISYLALLVELAVGHYVKYDALTYQLRIPSYQSLIFCFSPRLGLLFHLVYLD